MVRLPLSLCYAAERAPGGIAAVLTSQPNTGSAIADASEAIKIEPTFIKSYFRRGTAKLMVGQGQLKPLKEARADFKAACQIEPNNKDARAKLSECEKAIKAKQFELAIASDETPVKEPDPSDIEVESSYSGPRLDPIDGKVTPEFVHELQDYQKNEKRLHKKYALQILLKVRDILKAEPPVVDVTVPEGKHVTVCGDVHGQYYDLCNIFDMNGKPSETNPYLFNGDFVDRGSFSVEVILLLFAYKCLYPKHLHLNRGNHETINMNKMYGFEGEVNAKYTKDFMRLFTDIFQWLPLAHVIGTKVLVLHGGLFSKEETCLDDLRKISRHQEPPDEGPMTEMLWSDPGPNKGLMPSKRGVGVSFGEDVTNKFLQANGLDLLIRSHECKDEGYEVDHGGKTITVFSAPNYCDQMGNKGAFIHLDETLKPKFTTFAAVPHPSVRPMQYAGMFGAGLFGM